MPIPRPLLMVELLMSADRMITAAQQHSGATPAGEWTPAMILGHLSMVDAQVWIPRVDEMVACLGSAAPEFAWWEPDAEETRRAFESVGVDEAGARLLASRTALLVRLRGLPDEAWAATAQHAIFGTLDVEGLMMQVLGHDEDHRGSILLGHGST
jgi:hypothetical protein